jgi:hypothetical protein
MNSDSILFLLVARLTQVTVANLAKYIHKIKTP